MSDRSGWHESNLSPGRWWLTTVLLQFAILVFTFIGAHGDGTLYFQPLEPAALATIILVTGCVVLRTRAPWVNLGITLIADLISMSNPPVPFPGFGFKLGFLIAVFSVVSATSIGVAWLATIVCAVFELAMFTLVRGFPIWTFFPISSVALLIPAVTMGRMANYRNRYVESMEARAVEAERTREAEARRRVVEDRLATARNLHDVLGHQIAAVNLHAAVAAKSLPGHPDEALRSLSTIQQIAQDAIKDIGHLLTDLKSDEAAPQLTGGNVGAEALVELVHSYQDRGIRINVNFTSEIANTEGVDPLILDAAREGLANAEKHGSWDHPVELTIFNEAGQSGVRILNWVHESGHPELSMGHGLRGLERDISARGGTVTSERQDSIFTLEVRVPEPSRGAA